MMNDLNGNISFYPEILEGENIGNLSVHAQQLYGNWILNLQRGKTFYGLNWNWPDTFDSDPGGFYDTYVFTWHVDQWPHVWLKNFCESHADSQIIVISDYPLPQGYYDLPNLKCLVHYFWGVLFKEIFQISLPELVPMGKRQHLLSSLTNKPSYFKTLTTAHLLTHHKTKNFLLSWNVNLSSSHKFCSSQNFLTFDALPATELAPLVEFYHSDLKNKRITIAEMDTWKNDIFSSYSCDIPAYTNCLVNISNENYSQTLVYDTVLAGPFITEKTWKPLLAGCGLISQGPANVYSYLEQFGFVFDYPWELTYDQTLGDIDRFLKFLKIIDNFFTLDADYVAKQLQPSAEHNYYHIRSEKFFKIIDEKNKKYLEDFLMDL